jgi:hypothetical protein
MWWRLLGLVPAGLALGAILVGSGVIEGSRSLEDALTALCGFSLVGLWFAARRRPL